jgi:hypothetical protein
MCTYVMSIAISAFKFEPFDTLYTKSSFLRRAVCTLVLKELGLHGLKKKYLSPHNGSCSSLFMASLLDDYVVRADGFKLCYHPWSAAGRGG